MDFQQVLFHQAVQDRRMGKTALEAVYAVHNQGMARLLLPQKLDHALELGAVALG